jgi:hypothetical protein
VIVLDTNIVAALMANGLSLTSEHTFSIRRQR